MALGNLYKRLSLAFFLKFLTAGLQFLFYFLLAKQIGAKGVGVFQFALTISSFAVMISALGFPETLVKIISTAYEKHDWGVIKSICKKTFFLSGLIAVLFTSFFVIYSNNIFTTFLGKDKEIAGAVSWIALSTVPSVFQQLFSGLFRSIRKFEYSILLGGLCTSLFGVIGLLFFDLDTGSIIKVYLIALILNFTIGVYFFFNFFRPVFSAKSESIDSFLIFNTSLPLLTIAFVGLVSETGDILFLGNLMDEKSIGVYVVAKKVSSISSFILITFNVVISQEFSILYSKGDIKELKQLIKRTTRILTIFAVPTLIFIIFSATWIMNWFGVDFEQGKNVLIILSFGQFINTVTGPVGYLLIMCGFGNLLRNNILVFAILSLVLYNLIIPHYGIIGAAFVTTFAVGAQNLIGLAIVKNKIFT